MGPNSSRCADYYSCNGVKLGKLYFRVSVLMTLYVTDNEPTRQEVMQIVDTLTPYAVEIKDLATYTKSQRGALHVWCSQCAQVLNEADLYRERQNVLGHGTQSIPWTMGTFKEDIYKVVLDAITGKKSTEDQTTIDPTIVVESIREAFRRRKGIELPEWPQKKVPIEVYEGQIHS